MEKQATQSGQGSQGRKGIREAQAMFGPEPSIAPLRKGRPASLQILREDPSRVQPMEMQPKCRALHMEEGFLVLSPLQGFQLILQLLLRK